MPEPYTIEPPTGVVCLVFTDVEGSTALWERAPEAMREGLSLHDALMRAALVEHGGYEVKTEGDAFMVAFASARRALDWCVAVQRDLLDLPWPDALLGQPPAAPRRANPEGQLLQVGLRVRMGGHRGAPDCRPDPVTGRMDYFGPVVNRAARVGGCGHGGQVIASRALLDEARREGGPPIATRQLGTFRMKGLDDPEELLEVLTPGLEERRFPPVKAEGERRTNLTRRPDALLGRGPLRARVTEELATLGCLVTLIGPGGMGKTSLAAEAAMDVLESAAAPGGGVWFSDLTEARDAEAAAAAVAAVLEVPVEGARDLDEASSRVAAELTRRGAVLLVLDNVEQVAGPLADLVARWREACPKAGFLVTGRRALDLGGEVRIEVASLATEAGVELFRERSHAEAEGTDADVAALVTRLDGIPLAIELAAARARVISPAAMLERLEGGLDLLQSRRRDLPERQRTLRAAIAWSWDLLDSGERAALSQAAAFAGGFELAEAERVLTLPSGSDVLDTLESLVEHSLLVAQAGRFRMLETIRDFAAEVLAESSEAEGAARARHGATYLELAEGTAGTDLLHARMGPEDFAVLDREQANLLAAFGHLRGRAPRDAARLGNALAPWLASRGTPGLRSHVRNHAIEAARAGGDGQVLVRSLLSRAWAGVFNSQAQDARRDAEEALELAAKEELVAEQAFARGVLRMLAVFGAPGPPGDDAARDEEVMDLASRAGDPALEGWAETDRAFRAFRRGDFARAEEHYQEALARYREVGAGRMMVLPQAFLGACLWSLERPEEAGMQLAQALRGARLFEVAGVESMALQWIGMLAASEGRLDEARRSVEEALAVARRVDSAHGITVSLGTLAMIEMEAGAWETAQARIEGALESTRGSENPVFAANLRTHRAACLAARDRIVEAEAAFAELDALPPPILREAGVELQRGHLDLARARRARVDGDEAATRGHLRAARSRLEEAGSPAAERRAPVRTLRAALSRFDGTAPPA